MGADHIRQKDAGGEDAVVIDGLTVFYRGCNQPAVKDLSFSVRRGECLGIVGESGSGKSTAGMALMGYLPSNARIAAGHVRVGGTDVASLSRRAQRDWRGRNIAMVYQSPMTALNPLMTVGRQVAEAMTVHGVSAEDAEARMAALFERVRLPDPQQIAGRYPHQLSGGQLQRVVIAMALSCKPNVIVMDEPTTGLDVTTEAAILELVDELRRETGTTILLISHNLGLVAKHADRVVVMFKGEAVEAGAAQSLFACPDHDYTRALLEASPKVALPRGGRVPEATTLSVTRDRVLTASSVSVTFPLQRGGRRREPVFKALDDVGLDLVKGEILAVVGESGSGKTTLSRVIAGLYQPDIDSRIAIGAAGESTRVSMVFQDPTSTLNPKRTIGWTLMRTLALSGVARRDRLKRAEQLLEDVRLPKTYLKRLPVELSGGERQRVSIARALAQDPAVMILDEPTSALDVSVQKSALDLLLDLRQRLGLSILFVTHDLGVVRYIADRVAVMYRGKLITVAPTERLFTEPDHPYVNQLIQACMANQMPRLVNP
ncbi:ABC transporter ATP-binding protein [Martelella alba]|uniref:ABC transporter ATP-binding protein n=1 Tax=Martelella alba TaxID=2590451 RepID=A0A506U2V8_9HYPH|nr:ABC transporter ATP-binding protein [Martelella alba]TPW27335.1 ABC transporter ATP-binding protein [Martelella alba]